ncbi:MAG: YdiU family protein [Myxococcales bacterium]|nr:YdiU family protein [Myxococcales bacterium]
MRFFRPARTRQLQKSHRIQRLATQDPVLSPAPPRTAATGRRARYTAGLRPPTIRFAEPTYAQALTGAYVAARAAAAPAPRLVRVNRELAAALGLDVEALEGDAGARLFAGVDVPDGATPIALVYAGHQFGGFSPRLGDGRALLLGELVDGAGRRFDLQLKGSGPTPFARSGDGKATLGPMLREYVMGEAMAGLGVPTTRALAVVTTGESVWRERPLPGAVVARVAASHLRVGTFEYFAARGEHDMVARLTDYALERHGPWPVEPAERATTLLTAVVERQAALIAQWMAVGFIHGVMNTDNVAISGETIDYGPCAFMDSYDPETVYSSIDHGGRYAYGNQPRVAQWNLARLAETLLPAIDPDPAAAVAKATALIDGFEPAFRARWVAAMGAKLGLAAPTAADAPLIDDFLAVLAAHRVDFTLAFRALGTAAVCDSDRLEALAPAGAFAPWLTRWRARLGDDGAGAAARMRTTNPAYIARNHRVEEALTAAVERDDLRPFEALLEVLARPFDAHPAHAALADAPPDAVERTHRTFCGT